MATRGHLWWRLLQRVDVVGSSWKGALQWRSFSCIAVKPIRLDIPQTVRAPRRFHLTCTANGLDEFFQKGDDLIEDAEKTGRSWLARELRHKSSEDLHKLWYVLLKERNMLLTQQHEANRLRFIIPAPDRLRKVRQSMSRIKLVIGERNRAVREARVYLRSQETPADLNEEEEVEIAEAQAHSS